MEDFARRRIRGTSGRKAASSSQQVPTAIFYADAANSDAGEVVDAAASEVLKTALLLERLCLLLFLI